MKIVFLYAGYSGYFCACCRALTLHRDVELKVFALTPQVPFSKEVTEGVPLEKMTLADYADYGQFSRRVLSESPDALIISGWGLPFCGRIIRDKRFAPLPMLAIIDTSWDASWRQLGARLVLRKFTQRINGIIVAGERGRIFARWIGFPSNKIFISAYGCDYSMFSGVENPIHRNRSFLYVARYVRQKGIETLLAAHGKYRRQVDNPWPLNCYGSGPLKEKLRNAPGVVEHGFAQPMELPRIFSENGVYVLPSDNEPWGVSLVEAAAGGMPLLASHMVTSTVDVVRHLYNGLVFPAGDVDALTACLVWYHEHESRLHELGEASRNYARAYSAEMWAERIIWAVNRCVK